VESKEKVHLLFLSKRGRDEKGDRGQKKCDGDEGASSELGT